ncbi:MAG: tetratricopeptide repeat protein, partial [Solirubrobacteraceae bacterium]
MLARNSDPAKDQGFDVIGDVGSAGALSGANQLLFIIDTCFSGEAVSAAEVVAAVLQGQPPDASRLWVGVLASCLSVETARDGLLGRKMRELLERGPEDPLLRVRWSRHNEFLRGDDLCDAVLKEWDSEVQAPQFQANGNAWWMFRNPLYDADAPEQVVEHLLRAARGGAHVGERSWFTGRTEEVNQVVGWVRDGRPGVHVVMGSAGTGKSAIVGRVVSLSNPQERARLLNEGGWDHADPGERAVSAHVHVRGLTADRAADLLGEQLVRCGLLAAQEQRRNASELVGQVQRVVDGGCRAPVVVLDGLDEARGEAFSIAEELLVRLGRHAVVVVSTRELRRGDERPSLVRTLAPDTDALDLDDPAVQERGRGDLRDYVAARLAGVSDRMDSGKVAEHLAEVTSMSQQRPFLLARLVADQLLEKPVDTSSDDWRKRVSRTIEEAFENDLRSVEPRPNDALEGVEASDAARALLGALTWGLGAGLPEDEWLAIARCTSGVTVDREDVAWVLDQLGRFIVQDSEAGVAVYRLAHQSLADYLRAPYHADYEHPFDPDALPIAATLLDRYKVLLEGGVAVEAPGYLWRYAWRHTALAGPDGLQVLRALSQRERGLASDVAAAAIEIAGVLRQWGHRQDALAPTEEAVTLYRELAAQNPAFLPNLAMALNKLGNRYAEVGRRGDALAPTEEAVTLRRELAAQNPAFQPDLAMALNNLGNRYAEVGRREDAVAPTEEAVTLYRELTAQNPAFLPNLAGALNNLGNRYSDVGRRQDALAPTDEAVTLCLELAAQNPAFLPDLSMALTNLGNRYAEVGRRQDALAPTEEAVMLYRELAAQSPAFLPDLAGALNNLGTRYSDVGRRGDALAPTEEAVTLRRELAAQNPAFVPDLAGALNNIGNRYAEVGRREDAVAPTEEAVTLYRELT